MWLLNPDPLDSQKAPAYLEPSTLPKFKDAEIYQPQFLCLGGSTAPVTCGFQIPWV